MAWLLAGATWLNMDQALHVSREGDEVVVTFAVGLSQGTFPYMQRYGGEAAEAILAWLQTEAAVEAAENALTIAAVEDEIEEEIAEATADALADSDGDMIVMMETADATPDDEEMLGGDLPQSAADSDTPRPESAE